MFCAAVLTDEYRKVDAESVQAVANAVTKAGTDLGFVKLDEAAFGSAKSISIDYAVMEKTARAAVVPVACGWSDVGSWHAVWELSGKDGDGNAVRRCGIRGFPAIATYRPTARWSRSKASMISWWSRPRTPCWSAGTGRQRVEAAVAKLKTVAPQVTEDHIRGDRPWGSYQSVDNGDRHQVKRIIVKPGGRLSLESRITAPSTGSWCAGRRRSPSTNWSRPCTRTNWSTSRSARHRLQIPGKIQLELIEVQTGSYFGEDDIIQVEGRLQAQLERTVVLPSPAAVIV